MPDDTPQHDVVGRVLEQRQRAATRQTPHGEEVEAPIHWPSLVPLAAQHEWPKLAEWVDALRARYRGLDSYVVPACWFEHESLVVALQALRDHERVAYAKSSPGSAGTDWHRALRDISAQLRQFTADLRCGHGAEYAEGELFDKFMADDIARRRRRAATVALGE
ncbi:MAG: hypothetical protein ACHP7H_00260 [Hyphomicrobiales bacterium]